MGNEIHFFAAGLAADFLNALSENLSAIGNGCGRGLISIVDLGAVFGQRSGDAPPVIEETAIPEKDTMDHHDGVFSFADLRRVTATIQRVFLCFIT